jgi:hypothetical protein
VNFLQTSVSSPFCISAYEKTKQIDTSIIYFVCGFKLWLSMKWVAVYDLFRYNFVMILNCYRVFGVRFIKDYMLIFKPYPANVGNTVSNNNANRWQVGFNSAFKGLICLMFYFMFVDPCIIVEVINRNPTRCNNVKKFLLFHIYMKLNMFRVTHRLSSGALNCTGSFWF